MCVLLVLADTEMGLVITPPTDDRSTLVLVPLDVFLLSVNVSQVHCATETSDGSDRDDRVRGWVLEPNCRM